MTLYHGAMSVWFLLDVTGSPPFTTGQEAASQEPKPAAGLQPGADNPEITLR